MTTTFTLTLNKTKIDTELAVERKLEKLNNMEEDLWENLVTPARINQLIHETI